MIAKKKKGRSRAPLIRFLAFLVSLTVACAAFCFGFVRSLRHSVAPLLRQTRLSSCVASTIALGPHTSPQPPKAHRRPPPLRQSQNGPMTGMDNRRQKDDKSAVKLRPCENISSRLSLERRAVAGAREPSPVRASQSLAICGRLLTKVTFLPNERLINSRNCEPAADRYRYHDRDTDNFHAKLGVIVAASFHAFRRVAVRAIGQDQQNSPCRVALVQEPPRHLFRRLAWSRFRRSACRQRRCFAARLLRPSAVHFLAEAKMRRGKRRRRAAHLVVTGDLKFDASGFQRVAKVQRQRRRRLARYRRAWTQTCPPTARQRLARLSRRCDARTRFARLRSFEPKGACPFGLSFGDGRGQRVQEI